MIFNKVSKNDLIEFAFLSVFAVLPFLLILSPLSLCLLLLVILIYGNKNNFLSSLKGNFILTLLVAFYIYNVVGLFYSINLGLSYTRINNLLPLIIIPILFGALKLDIEKINKAKRIFIISMIAFCIFALITLVYNLIVNYKHRMDYNFIQTSMYHFHYPYDVLYINTAYVLLLFGSFFNKYKYIFSILFFAIILLSGVRMGIFIYTTITLVYMIANFKKLLNFKTLFILIICVLIGVMLIKSSRYVNDKFYDTLDKLGFGTKEYVSDIGENYHKITLRNKLWQSAIDVFKEKPLFGFGPQGSRASLNEVYQKNGYSDIQNMNSHNQYITTTLNQGIVGLIILLTLFLYSIICSIKVKNVEGFLITSIIMIAFFTESMLERQKGVTFFAIFISLIAIENAKKQKAQLTNNKY